MFSNDFLEVEEETKLERKLSIIQANFSRNSIGFYVYIIIFFNFCDHRSKRHIYAIYYSHSKHFI